jgi:hypothetical protein
MEQLQTCVDRLVSAGIQSYIGLLCCGEQERSRDLLRDVLQLSGLSQGGPSSKVGGGPGGMCSMLMYFTIRGVLASLLVLRATVYWAKIPDLEQLHRCSRRLADVLEIETGISREAHRGAAAPVSDCDCDATGYSEASDCGRLAPRPGVCAVS